MTATEHEDGPVGEVPPTYTIGPWICAYCDAPGEGSAPHCVTLQRVIDGYDRTPAEQRAADAEAQCAAAQQEAVSVRRDLAHVAGERDAARAALSRVEALANDMQERGRPGDGDSPTDTVARRQVREDVKRLRAALSSDAAPQAAGVTREAVWAWASDTMERFQDAADDDAMHDRVADGIFRALAALGIPVADAPAAPEGVK